MKEQETSTSSFAYRLCYADRKSLSLKVELDGSLSVRAPYGYPTDKIDAFVLTKQPWICRCRQRLAEQEAAYPPLSPTEKQALREYGRRYLDRVLPGYAARLGVQPVTVRITDPKKRFGSCSSNGTLCFALSLFRYPEAAVDYVIVHELSHLIEPNHSPAFYALVASVLPDYRERERLLRS